MTAQGVARALSALLVLGAACENAAPPAVRAEKSAPALERNFGAPLKVPGAALDVAQVLAAPKSYLQQTIKCQGIVSRVCEAAGCWLELRADSGGPGLRVPMAGHSFFVSQDIVGKKAIVEGTLSSRALTDAELAHLQGEGLAATGPLFLAATSVVVASDRNERSGLSPSERHERSRVH